MRPRVCIATVARLLRRPLHSLASIYDPITCREQFGLSLSEMGELLGECHPNGHGGQPFHRSTVWHIERGRAMSKETREAYALAVDRIIRERTGGRVTVKAQLFKRRWKFRAFAVCPCGREYKATDLRVHHCPRCRSKP